MNKTINVAIESEVLLIHIRCNEISLRPSLIKVNTYSTWLINSWLDILGALIASRDDWNAPLCPIVLCDEELPCSFSTKVVSIILFDQSHSPNKAKLNDKSVSNLFLLNWLSWKRLAVVHYYEYYYELGRWRQKEPDIHFRMKMVTTHPVQFSLYYLTTARCSLLKQISELM